MTARIPTSHEPSERDKAITRRARLIHTGCPECSFEILLAACRIADAIERESESA